MCEQVFIFLTSFFSTWYERFRLIIFLMNINPSIYNYAICDYLFLNKNNAKPQLDSGRFSYKIDKKIWDRYDVLWCFVA